MRTHCCFTSDVATTLHLRWRAVAAAGKWICAVPPPQAAAPQQSPIVVHGEIDVWEAPGGRQHPNIASDGWPPRTLMECAVVAPLTSHDGVETQRTQRPLCLATMYTTKQMHVSWHVCKSCGGVVRRVRHCARVNACTQNRLRSASSRTHVRCCPRTPPLWHHAVRGAPRPPRPRHAQHAPPSNSTASLPSW